jgi:chemotaxis protein CheX
MKKSIQQLEELTCQGVCEVFQSMASIKVTSEPASTIEDSKGQIIGSVGFVGDVSGVIHIYTGVSFVRLATSKMLGINESEVDDEMINDALGELTNMIAGYVKTRLSGNGPCALTIPSIVRGQRLSVEGATDVTRKIIGFSNCNHRFLAELLLKN